MISTVSFEFFPPKTPDAMGKLQEVWNHLVPFAPQFISVTYGAGGSTRQATLETIRTFTALKQVPVAMHLTCVGASKAETLALADEAYQAGVRHLVALRGDAPKSQEIQKTDGFPYAADLVAALAPTKRFEIMVAGYPETHPEAVSPEADLDALKRKVDAGANRILTQFFLDNADFYRFREKAVAAGIRVPIVAGMLPIYSLPQVTRFAGLCGAKIPQAVQAVFAAAEGKPWQRELTAWFLTRQCEDLNKEGVNDFHFYTLNRSEAVGACCLALGRHQNV